jgi:formylglycine-generating enzyme required for sulfatase activity
MSTGVLIRDALGSRRVERADFPLALGGRGCALPMDSSATEPLAWLGLHDEGLFLQPTAPGALLHNGQPLQQSAWLHAGDVVTIGNSSLRMLIETGVRTLIIENSGVGNATAPPAAAASKSVTGDTAPAIEPLQRVPYRARPTATSPAARARRRLPLGLTAFAIGVIALLWYLASGVAVQIKVVPASARTQVHGSWLTPRLGSQLFVLPGHYELQAAAAGYESRQLGFDVSGKAGQSVSLQLQKLPGKLRVTLPAVGTMQVDGAAAVAVPGLHSLVAGRHHVAVNVAGYLPWSDAVDILGEGKEQTLAPTLAANAARVDISSEPSGALVLIDHQQLGTTPFSQTLAAGSHPLELRKTGMKPWTIDVLVKAGQSQTIGPVRLGLPDAVVTIRSVPLAARVTVGGVYRGQTPLRLVLRAELDSVLTVTLPGYTDAQRSLRPRPGTNADVEVNLQAILGTIMIRSKPADAEVWVDGVSRGAANQPLQLTAIAHQVELRKSGYLSFTTTVTPRPGFEQAVDVQLQTEAQQRQARVPATIRAAAAIELKLMPVGHYVMGSSRREPGRRANEGQRPVELRRMFYLGVREITNAEFHQFRSAHKSGMFGGVSLNLDNQPVVQVSWQDAAAFCNWLSQKDGLPPAYQIQNGELSPVKTMTTGYRLPSEAEWEWAARFRQGSAALRYPWGDQLPVAPASGNYADLTARTPLQDVIEGYDDGFVGAAPVGSYATNAVGLNDLGGNVSEWTTDLYATSFSVDAEALDPMYLADGNQHAVRGASWRTSSPAELRLSARAAAFAARDDLGFRIARYAE